MKASLKQAADFIACKCKEYAALPNPYSISPEFCFCLSSWDVKAGKTEFYYTFAPRFNFTDNQAEFTECRDETGKLIRVKYRESICPNKIYHNAAFHHTVLEIE